MTRAQQIAKALALLAPSPAELKECQHEIGLALDLVKNNAASAQAFRAASSKNKGGLMRYYAALWRLRNAFNSLDPLIRPWFSLADPAYATGKALEKEIAKAKEFLNRPSAPPRRHASRNQAAVAAAYNLLAWRNKKATVTRGGKWEELAKVLTGDLRGDLFDHLRKFKRNPGPIIEKVRCDDGIRYRTRRRHPGIILARNTSKK
jgi:hypothetical protein